MIGSSLKVDDVAAIPKTQLKIEWLRPLLVGMRPRQWLKNGFVLAALVFAGQLGNEADIIRVAWVFVVFCLASACGYLINDVLDAASDREHPLKKMRPI